MLLLRLSAHDLLTLNARRKMVPHLAARWKYFRGSDASDGERSAWAESLVTLAEDLVAADRGAVQMIVECAATVEQPENPDEQRLIDVVLVGRHPETGLLSVQLVELKRWSRVTRIEAATAELVRVAGMKAPKKHPALQLRECYTLFTGDKGPLHGLDYECSGFAYMHNATDEAVAPLLDVTAPTGGYSRVYTRDSRSRMFADLKAQFTEDGGASEAERLLERMNLHNTPLLDAMISSRGEDTVFTLRGRQRRVAEDILTDSARLLDTPAEHAPGPDGRRAVFLVTGGAGTGKSAIGLQVRAQLEARGRTVKYASGSRAFNAAVKDHVGYRDKEFKERFAYFHDFVTTPDPPLDVLLCDEAHRLRERSTNHRWKPEQQGRRPQVDELLDAARTTVFFLDESQSVRPNEVGTVALIKEAAERKGVPVKRYDLREEFRCGGSDAYIRWVRALLGLSEEAPGEWTPDGLMHVETAPGPAEMERIIHTEARAGATARMVAGYCWPWTPPIGPEKRLEPDVRIGDWARPWNANSTSTCENGAPPSAIWAVHPAGIDQIGCVYTAQGLEWDWCGVIMGDDMVRRGDRWVFQRGKDVKDPETGIRHVVQPGSCDPKVRAKSLSDEEFARCVRHAYHVLLTRASRATVLCSTDEETQRYLSSLVGEVQLDGLRPTWENLPAEARLRHASRPRRSRRRRSRKDDGTSPAQPTLF